MPFQPVALPSWAGCASVKPQAVIEEVPAREKVWCGAVVGSSRRRWTRPWSLLAQVSHRLPPNGKKESGFSLRTHMDHMA